MDAQFWDERYETQEQLWSGEPNGALVAEVAELAPGQALDVGCGEGADALWLAARGWQVTAIDISRVALERAAAHADGNSAVAWTHADLSSHGLPSGAFDLVSAQYYGFLREHGQHAVHNLLSSVAPGGTLLIVSHDFADMTEHHGHKEPGGVDRADFYQPDEIADFLDGGWSVLVNERRKRVSPTPPGTEHIHDTVLRARRTA